MNKVVSIEIAAQVFWINEDAYDALQSYLKKIKLQSQSEDSSEEIYKDIELRVAELLYALNSDSKRAISTQQLDEVIDQVGFIDSEDLDEDDIEIPRKIYLEPKNKLLGGVCAGLSIRLKVPAFILRVLFLALAAFFGLGIVLYIIFWFSLDTINDRKSALAAQGQAQTAKKIATFEEGKEGPLFKIQRVIFLPISILGMLLSAMMSHVNRRRRGYRVIFKNLMGIAVLIASFFIMAILIEFNQSRNFSSVMSWIISASVMYLTVLGVVTFANEYYISKLDNRDSKRFKVNNKLKKLGWLPAIVLVVAGLYLNLTQREQQMATVEKSFKFEGNQFTFVFDDNARSKNFRRTVTYKIKTNDSLNGQINMVAEYSSYGSDVDTATNNLQSIEYFYTFDKSRLELDGYWTLKEDGLNRAQRVKVTIEVPTDVVFTSNWPFEIYQDNGGYQYQTYHYYSNNSESDSHTYYSSGRFIHEFDQEFKNKVSANERVVLENKFCHEFFISESWHCNSIVRYPVSENDRFDQAFSEHADTIEKLRVYLQPDRSLFVTNLVEMNALVEDLKNVYPELYEVQDHINYLIDIKSAVDLTLPAGSG